MGRAECLRCFYQGTGDWLGRNQILRMVNISKSRRLRSRDGVFTLVELMMPRSAVVPILSAASLLFGYGSTKRDQEVLKARPVRAAPQYRQLHHRQSQGPAVPR